MKQSIRPIATTILALLAFVACGDDSQQPYDPNLVDARLTGEWYRVVESQTSAYSPPHSIYGFQILSNRQFRKLGVETASGKLDLLPDDGGVRIELASRGRIELSFFRAPSSLFDTVYYSFLEDTLFVSGSTPISGTWIRSYIGSVVTAPVRSNFEVTINGVHFVLPPVATSPGGWLSMTQRVILHGSLSNGRVSIEIEDFAGTGRYEILPNRGSYSWLDGDALNAFVTDNIYTGFITVDRFDEQELRCTGTFEFNACTPYKTPPDVQILTDGQFDVPIFR